MPYPVPHPRTSRRRRRIRRRRKIAYKRKYAVPRNPIGIPLPKKLMCKFRYYDNITLASSTDPASNFQFVANGIYNCTTATPITQPRGFDQLLGPSQFYEKFTVVSSKITVKACNKNTLEPAVLTLSGHRNVNFPVIGTLSEDVAEWSHRKMTNLGPLQGSPEGTLTLGFSAKKHLGFSEPMDEEDLRGSALSNPQQLYYFNVSAYAMDNAASSLSPGVLVECIVDYNVVLSMAQEPPAS